MTVYIIVLVHTIVSLPHYTRYGAGFVPIFSQHSGTMLAASNDPTVIEAGDSGEWPHARTVLMSFPSEEAFNAWYKSAEYQELVKERFAGAKTSIVMLPGLESVYTPEKEAEELAQGKA